MNSDKQDTGQKTCLARLPLTGLAVVAILLGLAPFQPEPHLIEKLRMLTEGTLSKPIDIFDLIMHGSMPLLLIAKLICMMKNR